mgnify:CR=1 FL=1
MQLRILIIFFEFFFFFFQAEDGIRGVERSRGLGDVYKGQVLGGVPKNGRFRAVFRGLEPARLT